MKYKEILFKISAPEQLSEAARDVMAALAAEAGLEAFEQVEGDADADDIMEEAAADILSDNSGSSARDIPDGDNVVSLLKGYAREDLFDASALETLAADFPIEGVSVSFTVGDADDRDWNEAWEKKGFEPVVVDDKLCVHDLLHFPARAFDIDIAIDAKQAFGTGTHDTTQMILQHLLNINMEGRVLLDCGCGTGILSIAALKMGAAAAAAYDIDEWSSDNTRHNADINGVGEGLTVVCGDASAIPGLCSAVGPFDIVVANINRNILLADMPAFAGAMRKQAENNNGSASKQGKAEFSQERTEVSSEKAESGRKGFGTAQLVLSGFYDADIPLLEEKAASLGLHKISEYHSGEWACVVFQNG